MAWLAILIIFFFFLLILIYDGWANALKAKKVLIDNRWVRAMKRAGWAGCRREVFIISAQVQFHG